MTRLLKCVCERDEILRDELGLKRGDAYLVCGGSID